MSVLDYSSTPGNNTSLASLSLAEGGTRTRDINNMLRQLLADIKAGLMVRADNAAAVNAWDFASSDVIPKTITVDQLGAFYYDSTDTTTADNGTSVLVTTSGQRYKIFPSSSPEAIEEDAATKFSDGDTTPSVSGRKTWRFADAPGNITAFEGMADGEEKIIYSHTTAVSFYLTNSASLVCPGNQNYIVGRYDPPIWVIQQNSIQYVIPLGQPRRASTYGYEDVNIASGTASPTRKIFVLNGESAAADNLVTLTVSNIFKPGEELTAIIDQLPGKAITVVHGTGNITTPNGKNYTFSAKRLHHYTIASISTVRKEIYFRVNEAGTGVELLEKNFSVLEEQNEPFGTQDEAVIFFFGQSNCGPTTVTGTTTASKTYVKCQKTGTLTWAAYNTTADFQQNCHVAHAAMYCDPHDSWANWWETNQGAYSLPVCNAAKASQGGQGISDKSATANVSRWNPDRLISSTGGGGGDPATDGIYPVRWTGNTDSNAKWSLYELAQQMIRAGLKEIEDSGKRPRVLGVCWIHGEEDSKSGAQAAEYYVNLQRLYGAICNAFGRKVPFFMSAMRSQNTLYTHRATIYEAMLSFTRTEPWAQIIDPATFDNYDAGDTADTPPNLGIFGTDAGAQTGVHFNQTTCDNWAIELANRTVKAGFYGVTVTRADRERNEHRTCYIQVKANGSGSNDNGTTYDEYLTASTHANANVRYEKVAGVYWNSTSQTLVSSFDPTTGRFTVPYTGLYEIEASFRTSPDNVNNATSSTTGTTLYIYSNSTRGAAWNAGTLEGQFLNLLITESSATAGEHVFKNATGRTMMLNGRVLTRLTAGSEVIIANNNYRQSSSSTDYHFRGSMKLLEVE